MKSKKYIFTAIFWLFWGFIPDLRSQELSGNTYRFQHITSNDYYGIGNVWDIIEDYEGFIWFATEDGLIKYDGYEPISFKNEHNNPNSLSSNFLLSLLEDSKGNLWIGTLGSGLNLYDRRENKFYRFNSDLSHGSALPNDRVMTIFEDKQGRLWIGTEGGGIALMDSIPTDPALVKFRLINNSNESPVKLSGEFIRSPIVEDQQGNIYVAAYGHGINIIDPSIKSVQYLRHDPENVNSLSSNNIYDLFIDSKNRLWIGTEKSGLDLYLIDEKRFIHYTPTREGHTLNNGEIEIIAEDQKGNIWVGSDDGLSMIVESGNKIPANKFINIYHEPQYEYSLLSNSIKYIYVDKNNSLWVSSYYGGINVYNKDNFKFTAIRNKTWIPSSLPVNNVTSFAEDTLGNLWIGTDGGGLNVLKNGIHNIYQDNYQPVTLTNPFTGERQHKIKALKFDFSGNLWIGTWASGVFKYNLKSGKQTYYGISDPNTNFKAFSVLSVEVDQDNHVWVGSLTDGIGVYHPEKDSFYVYTTQKGNKHNLGSDRINSIFADSQNRIWVGGELGGLSLYHRESGTFKTILYKDILTRKINIVTIRESKGGKILIGTIDGLIIYDPELKSAKLYNEESGFPNNVIHSIVEDNEGAYWLTTNLGITVMNPADESIVSFNSFDGLQGNIFNNNSALRTSNGLILIGGTNGWNGFDQGSINKSVKKYPIVFTRFYLDGKEMKLNMTGSPLSSHITAKEPLVLNHRQNNVGFEVTSLEYSFSRLNKYSYLLEGFNKDWQNLGSDRKIFFTNLFPGKYTLRIRSTNKDGLWHEMEGPLFITIIPAWWQTFWFKMLVVALLLAIVFGIISFRTRFLLKQKIKLEKEVEGRTIELRNSNLELNNKNNEIQAQNEELSAQNDQIGEQREELEMTQEKLKQANLELENKVEQRTRHLQMTIKKLDKTVKELDRFVYSASHDLSAPMKSIRGLLEIALREKGPDKINDCLQHIKSSSKRFEDVIKNMVDYSRNIHYDIKLTPINLFMKVDQLYSELRYWPEARNMAFFNELDTDLVLYTDENRLDTILRNLINNALKYSDDEKEHPFVKVRGIRENGSIKINVIDNGIGMDSRNVNKIFDMFYRASEKSTGSGLGLYIVSESLYRIKGKVEVGTELNKGTTFTISIPQNHTIEE